MKVCILAGGMGHRISDDEERIPKPLTEIGDIPIIEHIMNIYDFYGHKEFILCLGYKDYLIKEYFKNYELYNYNMQKNLSTGEEKYWKNFSKQKDWLVNCISTGLKTATGSRVKKIRNYIDDTFMLTYGDGLANINLDTLIKFHKHHKRLITITVVRPTGNFGVVEIDDNNQVLNFQEKPRHEDTFINIGYMIVEPEALTYIKDEDNEWWEKDTLPKLVKDNQVMAYVHTGKFKAMDSPKDKLELEKMWENNEVFWRIEK